MDGPNQLFARLGVIPVLSVEAVDQAEPLADALAAGGLPLAEITFRTTAAAAVIERLAKNRPEVLVGAGTVLSVESLLAARDAGARFALSPGFSPEVVARAREIGMPFYPGVMTPSEIQGALAAGAPVMKFFPAQLAGGPAMLRGLAAPYAFYGVRFIPTGGVNQENLATWLALESVVAVGGTWIATAQQVAAGDWAGIRTRAAAALAAARGCRPASPAVP
jgi:2-dehydro-3-deoxyphosphogluconate aldolase/(4S)-4-hydroxy-2-oxoglutarate aldolase